MIIAWSVPDLMAAIGMDAHYKMTGVKLSLDEQYIEFRVIPNKAIDQLVYTIVKTGEERGSTVAV